MRIFFVFICLIAAGALRAQPQVFVVGNAKAINRSLGEYAADSGLKAPVVKKVYSGYDSTGLLAVVGGTFYYHNGATWVPPSGTGISSIDGGTNISIAGTTVPTVSVTGTISMANGGTGTTSATSVNATPITYGTNNTITAAPTGSMNVTAGTNIAITGSTSQALASTPSYTVGITGTIGTGNGGTGATTTTSVNGTPITYGANNSLSVGSGTVTSVIGGTNILITGTASVQPTVNITGTIGTSNGGTGTSATTSVNATPITYGSNNTITVPISTGVTGLGSGVATWAATPSSSNLASALTDETGSGVAVFNDKPTFKGTIQTITAVAAQAFDGSTGNMFTRTLAASETFTQSNFSTGQNFIVKVKQGSGTSYTVTWWSGITWITSGGTAPTQTTTSNGYTTYGFTCTGSNTFDGYLIATQ